MEDVAPGPLSQFLIVTGNYVVAEDLKEILASLGPARIDVAATLDDPWPESCAIAFIGKPLRDLTDNTRVRNLQRMGTHVVVLNGHLPFDAYDGTGFHILAQPFRSEDVLALLSRLGLETPAN